MLDVITFPAKQKTSSSSRSLQQHIFPLLQNCNTINKLNQIHTRIIVHNLTQKNFILVNLLSSLVDFKNLFLAGKVFERIEKPSTNAWNQMIRGYSKSENDARRSVELYNEMAARKEAEPDGYTFCYVVNGCVKSGSLREGEQIHGCVLRNGFDQNVFVCTNLINLYGTSGLSADLDRARKVFDEMSVKSLVSWNSLLSVYMKHGDFVKGRWVFDEMPERNVVSWTTMISRYAHNGLCKEAMSLFSEMKRARIDLDHVVLAAVLSACAELGDLRLGKCVHSYVITQPSSVSLQNALIHMYASCGVVEEAYEVFKQMKKRNTVSWTSMITGFAKQGRALEALVIFHSMQAAEEQPDEITFIGVLCACSYAGFVDEGRYIFNHMESNWGIKARIKHYCCMVDLLSRAGFVDEARQLIQTMPMKPNDAVWAALLNGCMIYMIPKLAYHATMEMPFEPETDLGADGYATMEMPFETDLGADYLALLSNIYAMDKRWDDVAVMRRKMVEMDVRKPAGSSWVHMDGEVHRFQAYDLNHKHAVAICETVLGLTSETKWVESFESGSLCVD